MKENAIKKLKDEMNKNKDNFGIQAIGNFLISYIEKNPEASKKIMDNKTIAEGFNEIRKVAFKRKFKNYAFISDQEGFQIVLKYFGIDDVYKSKSCEQQLISKTKKNPTFDVKLEDLLEEGKK